MYELKAPSNIKLTVENPFNGSELVITMSPHSDIRDWMNTFKTILIHQTFGEDQVKELFEGFDEF